MTWTVDELRDENAKLKEQCERQRRQLGGASAANARKSQRIKELEAENARLRDELIALKADDDFGRKLQAAYEETRKGWR